MYAAALRALACCRRHGLVTGGATSVSASNFADTATPAFVDEMTGRGAHYVWYYIYRPSGPRPGFGEALTDEQVRTLRRFCWRNGGAARTRSSSMPTGTTGPRALPRRNRHQPPHQRDGRCRALPPVQCSDCRLAPGDDVAARVEGSPLLAAFRAEAPRWTRGCALMDHPAELAALALRCGARDTSGRGTFFEELSGRPF
jgi:hypothetical protein